MAKLLALLLILMLANALVWVVAISLDCAWTGNRDLLKKPVFWPCSALFVAMVSVVSFIGFGWGYFLSLVLWWLAARNILELPWLRALVLFLLLAGLSLVEWLAGYGVLFLMRS